MKTVLFSTSLLLGLVPVLSCTRLPETVATVPERAEPSTQSDSQELSETSEGKWIEELVASMNAADVRVLRSFVDSHYSQDANFESEVRYWASVHEEVGPLELFGREDSVHWFRGTVTKAWLGIRVELDESSHLVDRGVRRGVRPALAPPAPPVRTDEAIEKELTAYFDDVASAGHFSGAVIVARRGVPFFSGAYGYADRESQRLNRLDTPFRLASAGKMFTGVAAALLAQERALNFSDPIGEFIPDLPPSIGEVVRVENLLTHTSGIEIERNERFGQRVRDALSIDDLVSAQVEYFESPDGRDAHNPVAIDRFDYSNEGFDLLGAVIEGASDEAWADFLERGIFEPAGMSRTAAAIVSAMPGLATPYTFRNSPIAGERIVCAPSEPALAWRVRPAGSAVSSATDVLHFLNALQSGLILDSELAAKAVSPQVTIPSPPGIEAQRGYGYGFESEVSETGTRRFGHGGGTAGVSTAIRVYPDLELTIIVLSNFDRTAWWTVMHIEDLLGAA